MTIRIRTLVTIGEFVIGVAVAAMVAWEMRESSFIVVQWWFGLRILAASSITVTPNLCPYNIVLKGRVGSRSGRLGAMFFVVVNRCEQSDSAAYESISAFTSH